MSAPPIISAQWDGEVLRPLRRHARACDDTLTVGEVYRIEVVDEAQSARDRQFHAALREAWLNLPEAIAEEFPSVESFRHYLLVKCGYCTTVRLPFASERAARESLPLLQTEGAILHVERAVVTVIRPMSQKLRGGMPKEQRLQSYRDVADMAAGMVGVTPAQIAANVDQAA